MAIELPGETWEEEQVRQVIKALSPDRKAWVIDVRTDSKTSRTHALLEWRKGVPKNFKGTSVQLANKTKFCLTHPEGPGESPISSRQSELAASKVRLQSALNKSGVEPFTKKKRAHAKTPSTHKGDPPPGQPLAKLKQQYNSIQKRFQETSRLMVEQIRELDTKSKSPRDSHPKQGPVLVMQRLPRGNLPEMMIRKDFKIEGQIGEKAQKGKMSYTNLMHQINVGLHRGYPEPEIVEAVVKAISPGLSLRSMLEMKNGLTLVQLRRMLKSHYKEKNASELYHMAQDSRETPQNFLFRAIELKDRLLLVSQGEDSDEHFGTELIQKKFLRSVSTGLRSDYIKFQLRQYLDDPSISDEVVIEETNEAANLEMEREKKRKKVQPNNSLKGDECQPNVSQCLQEPSVS